MGFWRPASGGRQVAHHLHTSRSRNSRSYLKLLRKEDRASCHTGPHLPDRRQSKDPRQRPVVREWLEGHPRMEHAFIPKGAAWLNLMEGWWRIFRRQAFAGQCFADSYEIAQATRVATRQLNQKAKPWVWGRPVKPPRHRRRIFVYRL
jgi:hypothetical protein